jgi:hypothetical protein
MFLIIAFLGMYAWLPFLELFGQEHKFETWIENFLGNCFSQGNLEIILFLSLY